MKKCFTFKCYADCKKVTNFLQTVIPTTVHHQLGNAITVETLMYGHAILQGKKFVSQEKIDCNWVDYTENEVPLHMAPFAIVTLDANLTTPPYCLPAYALTSITHFADLTQSIIARKVHVQPRPDGTIAFLIACRHDAILEHGDIVDKLKDKKEFLKDSIFTNVAFTDIFGKPYPQM